MGVYTEELLGHMTQQGTGTPRFGASWSSNDSGREVYCGSWAALVDMTSNGRGDICTNNGGATGLIGWAWVDMGGNNTATNSKLQMRGYETWILRKSTSKWERLWSAGFGAASKWNASGNLGTAGTGYSVAIDEGGGIYTPNRSDFNSYGLEYWPTGGVDAGVVNRALIADCAAVHIRSQYRVALINSGGTDDRAKFKARARQGWDIGNQGHPGWSGANPVRGGGFTRPEKIDQAIAIGDYTRAYPGYAMDGGSGRWVEIPFNAADPDRWYVVSGTAVQCAQITGYYGAWATAAGVGQYTGQTAYGRDAPYVLTAAQFRANPPPDPDLGGTTSTPATYTILCIGDSITAGSNDGSYVSWRGRFQDDATAKAVTFDMVGPQSGGTGGGSDNQHAGYPGACIDATGDSSNNINDRLNTIFSGISPNVVIVGPLGYNDYYKGGSVTTSAGTRLSSLLAAIRTKAPSAKMVVSTLHPERGQTAGTEGADWTAIVNAAKNYCTTNSSFATVADLSTLSLATADYWDVIHPSSSGAQKIGDRIYAAFETAVTGGGGGGGVIPGPITSGLPTVLTWITKDATAANRTWIATASDTAAPAWITDTLPVAVSGQSYTATVQASGIPAPTFSVTAGSLPTGLSLNSTTGVISGTVTGATATFTVRATNSVSTADRAFTLTVTAAPIIGTTTLPQATVGTAYSATLQATGATPISWSIVNGSLPAGLTLTGATISGTPTTDGTATFDVRASNSAGSATQTLSITVGSLPVITTSSPLAEMVVGTAVSVQLQATGQGPITWSVPLAQLPAGLTLSAAGLLSGTPTTAATGSMIVTATNSAGSASKSLSWSVVTVSQKPAFVTTSLPAATVGTAYSQALSTTGATPKTYAIASGSLPSGLSLSSGGVISGTPTAAETRTVIVSAINSYGTATQALTIVVNAAATTQLAGGWSRWLGK